MIDLGTWAAESYRVPEEERPEDDDPSPSPRIIATPCAPARQESSMSAR